MNRTDRNRRWLLALAVMTATTALLPIVVGALVTTLDAGMAFADWPTSDGQGMLAYPWLKSAGDKFIEHGHRLAGMLIGCVSIAFAASVWLLEKRRWVRWCGVAVLLAVIAQGLLGGGRVLADARLVAMFHGAFAAAVFALMSSVALVMSRGWDDAPLPRDNAWFGALKVLSLVTPLAILVQYSLGGLVRHLGTALFEHAGFALVVFVCVMATALAAHQTRSAWLRRPAGAMALIAVIQLLLGAATWVTKYGLAGMGYVAVERSPLQIVLRTSHTVMAMLLFMASILVALSAWRAEFLRRKASPAIERSRPLHAVRCEGSL